MIRTTLDEAALHLEELIDAAVRGEEVIITARAKEGDKIVRLVPALAEVSTRRKAGSAKGIFHKRDDFEAPLPDFDEYQ